MSQFDSLTLWTVILGLALGSFTLRFAFLALMGDRALPAWLMRHLRYTAVAILPALVTPLVVWPSATNGSLSLPHLAAALIALAVGYLSKNIFAAMGTGALALYGLTVLIG
ncbi:AzlD domain-containing protein [Parasedimentitalea psychrophila]|uniref:AzlD domain-containing protein n=1 Tax=Parasedimentitalea psychrophila TaxID=2997337 RepID=A0A9Y2L1F5_9RHOB|nr:AzlD domain-containing protein [Parasedimentitalea psychrophila]WIY26274.1 AzlD domain-containing protein [Parasedimentitalea psychrophila]